MKDEGQLASVTQVEPRWLTTVREENEKHPQLQRMHKLVAKGEAMGPWDIKHGVLFFRNKIYLPRDSDLILVLLQQFHEFGHEGFYKTLHRVQQGF